MLSMLLYSMLVLSMRVCDIHICCCRMCVRVRGICVCYVGVVVEHDVIGDSVTVCGVTVVCGVGVAGDVVGWCDVAGGGMRGCCVWSCCRSWQLCCRR